MKTGIGIMGKLLIGFLSIAIVILIAGILGVWSINSIKGSSIEVGVVNAPLGDAAMEIKLTSTTAHLIFEEIISGDANEDVNGVWELLDEAKWYCDAILDGGKNDEGTFYATKNTKVREKINRVKEDIIEFEKSAKERYEFLQSAQGIGTGIDQDFDEKYEKIQNELALMIDTYSSAQYVNVIKAAGNAQYLLANGHLFLEELMSGDDNVAFSDVLGNFKDAGLSISSITSDVEQYRINAIVNDIEKLTEMMKERYQNMQKSSGVGSEADKKFDEMFELFIKESDEAESLIHDMMDEGTDKLLASSQLGIIILLTAIGLSLFLAILIGLLLSIGISRSLNSITMTLKSSSDQIANAASQLSGSAEQIASGATEQAASIEETTASIEELTSMVKQNTGNAKEASLLSGKARESSETGFKDMENMVTSMNDITNSSEEIRNVIKVIDDIAFQTNILALNAAVEAARAGEAGMGFAVVADEVKNLANKSAGAAKETANMIEDSIQKTKRGLDITNQLLDGFKGILSNSQKLNEVSKEVEIASNEQDKGLDQVSRAIVQLDKVVQDNAGSAEETASSAEQLSGQAEIVRGLVNDLMIIVKGKVANQSGMNTTYHRTLRKPLQKPGDYKTKSVEIKRIENQVRPEEVIPFRDDDEFTEM